MTRATKTLHTLDYVSMLLQKSSKTIMKREYDNENRIHLYGVGQYWAAFDKSAYLLEEMTNEESDTTVLHFKDYPFPILMYCLHYEKVKDLCRKHIMAKQNPDYLQLLTHPIDPKSYSQWYRELVVDED